MKLVMATTSSPSATVWIIDRWQQESRVGDDKGRSTARASLWSSCLIRQMPKCRSDPDFVTDAAASIFQEHQKLAPFSGAPAISQHLVPESIRLHLRGRGDLRVRFADESLSTTDPAFCLRQWTGDD